MKPIPIHTAYLHPEEVLAIHEALVSAGHEELAGLLAGKANRTELEKRYAAAIQLADENVFSMDSSVDSAPLHPFIVTFKNPCRLLLGMFALKGPVYALDWWGEMKPLSGSHLRCQRVNIFSSLPHDW